MIKPYIKSNLILFLSAFFILFSILISLSFVNAAACWTYTSNSGCSTNSSCYWKNDSWGGWCEELNCWSIWDKNSCSTAAISGKNCSWQSGSSYFSCSEVSCWSFSGNQTACVNNTNGISCSWEGSCYNNGANPNTNCWSITTESTCVNTTGCGWGNCRDKGCFSYNDNVTCNAALDWQSNNCTWDSSSNYCKENRCWNYPNQTSCNNASGIKCEWKWNSCQDVNCWSWDATNATACVNNTANLSCSWSGNWCNEKGCWNSNTKADCELTSECIWDSWSSGGWCEEVQCWNWDSFKGGNKTACINNTFGLSCTWSGNPPGNESIGWCYKDIGAIGCTNFTTERECMDTFYCWWQYTNWNNISQGGACKDPANWNLNTNNSISVEWNPGCYIFDNNASNCGLILGCDNSSSGVCNVNSSHANANEITASGINCTMINNSQLCNNIPALSSCCSWQNGSCSTNRLTTSCWDQIQTPPTDSCEGANNDEDESNRKSSCDRISNDPWYMPCKWNNNTKFCEFKADKVFGNGTKTLIKIENKRNCEVAGGKWVTENYCEGNVSVPTGRCEHKFDDEDNCNKACFGCETKDSNGNSINKTSAKEACLGTTLGSCEFTADTTAPNGIGYCKAKPQFKKGIVGDCNSDCGDCSFKGDPKSNDTTKRPSFYCAQSKANPVEGGCKWISDNSSIGGYCVKKGEKTCEDACDRCYSQSDCSNIGRTNVANQSGSCKWQGTSDDGNCVANIGEDVEICWNGEDDDSDGLIDCADTGCYADSYCGFVEGDCFAWKNNNTCISNNCEWVVDKWGSWCDFKGSQCWRNDHNSSSCLTETKVINETLNISSARLADNNINKSYTFKLNKLGTGWAVGSIIIINASGADMTGNFTVDIANQLINFSNTTFMVSGGGLGNFTNVTYRYYTNDYCKWTNGSGTGWCEKDWSIAEQCSGSNKTSCASPCVWTNDTWCNGIGNGTDWCNKHGGWCDHTDFAPANCWSQTSSSTCNNQSKCRWKVNEWSAPHCEVNWSDNCWQQNTQNNCVSNGCYWRTETYGSITSSWCENNLSVCWSKNSQTTCETFSEADCTWKNYSWGGSCEPSCFNSTLSGSQSACGTVAGCYWAQETGWCEEVGLTACSNSNNSNNQTACSAISGCRWRNPGWCDPKDGGFSGGAVSQGGGGGGSFGADCYKYDGNQTLCTNKTIINISCGWTSSFETKCEVDWNNNCWQYSSEANGCNSTNKCWWNSNNQWCGNIMDQCWNNVSLYNNATLCTSNAYCNSTSWGGCEPRCFSATNAGSCVNNTGCKWVNGWCNPADMNSMFQGLESGGISELGFDICSLSETNQSSVDICGFGMKDMGDAYGFGARVFDFSNASICNKVKLSPFVMGLVGGNGSISFGGPSASERTGDGNDTVRFFVYLDTDGSSTGSCSLTNDNSAEGYEFRFTYDSEWNASKLKPIETFNAYKCENGKWTATDVKISAWKKVMCSEIGGPMIAIEKDDLTRFSNLYDSTKDIRVYVATADAAHNITNPSDTVTASYATPGSIDFYIDNTFAYGSDTAKFEDILKKGFIQYEDCFNTIDDDTDGDADCNDWDCEFSDKCTNKGVNAVGFSDTSSPLFIGVKIEEYSDSLLIMYDTNKPTNGTLYFYKNDSTCLNLNKTINDIGITSSNVRNYKMWHSAPLHNGADSLGYALTNNTKYFYKIKVCDTDGRCATSRCTNSSTVESVDKCGYCNYVTRIKEPTGWNVSYDVNQDGTYEHSQGQVCGPNAGMKTNYTDGRHVNIKLSKNDGTVYFEFINATLTKTGLNDKVRTISDSGDLIHNTNDGYAGLSSETGDKIINNLHPEVCKIKIPASGTCNSLFHCNTTGGDCTDRTSDATLLDSTNCVWQIPNCEFSTYDEDISTSSGSSSSSSGGGGGGGGGGIGFWSKTLTVSNDDFIQGYTMKLKSKERLRILIANNEGLEESHYVGVISLTSSIATINVSSAPQQSILAIGDLRKFDVTSDGYYDLSVTLNNINTNANGTFAELTVKSIKEKVSKEAVGEDTLTDTGTTGEVVKETEENLSSDERESKSKSYIWSIVALILIVLIGGVVYFIVKRSE